MDDPDQTYYWTPAWQADEQQAVAELARGEGVIFQDGRQAAVWPMQAAEPGERMGLVPALLLVGAGR